LFVGEFDAEASPLGAKGLGELTAASVLADLTENSHALSRPARTRLPVA
jgi:hypothetical protein